MTKAAKASRRRAEREELKNLRNFADRVKHGGVHAHNWTVGAEEHARLQMADKLGCALVLRPVYGTKEWQVYAARKPQ